MNEVELLAALEDAFLSATDPEGAMTMAELVETTGMSDKSLRPRLLKLKRSGKLEAVRVVRENLAGYRQPVPAYRTIKRNTP